MGICVVVIVFGMVMYGKTREAKRQIEELNIKQQQLEQQLLDEQQRSEELEERRIYVTTKKYVEEMAKKLGLVYPDEIIYRPDED